MPLAQDITGHNEGSPRQLMHSPRFSGAKSFPKLHFQLRQEILGSFGAEVEL